MKCPILAIGYLAYGDKQTNKKCDCLGEECAWWDKHTGGCSVLALPKLLVAIGNTLGTIANISRADKIQYRCRHCGTSYEYFPEDVNEPPAGWTRAEQVDGQFVYLCDRCSIVNKREEG